MDGRDEDAGAGDDAFAPSSELDDHPPALDAVMPAVILVFSVVYALSLRGIKMPEMNLLLLRPLLVLVWVLLAVVVVREVMPALRRQRAAPAAPRDLRWRDRFAPGTQLGAGLVVLATFVFSFFGPGDGPAFYAASLFAYVVVVGVAMGDLRPVPLVVRAGAITLILYVIMGLLLGVRL